MSIYHHFSLDEHGFIDQILDWKSQVENEYIIKKTTFLNPREQYIVQCVIGQSDNVHIFFNREMDGLERQRLILAPVFYEIEASDFDVVLLQVRYAEKFYTLEHSQVLGALMNVGIKRQMLGDILMNEKSIQIVVAKEIAPFVCANLTSIHRAKVEVSEISFTNRLEKKEHWKEEQVTLSSRRLDAVVSGVAKISRQKGQEWIQRECVQVNYQICTKIDRMIQAGDFLSIRKKGRVKIKAFLEKTKKDRERMVYDKLY